MAFLTDLVFFVPIAHDAFTKLRYWRRRFMVPMLYALGTMKILKCSRVWGIYLSDVIFLLVQFMVNIVFKQILILYKLINLNEMKLNEKKCIIKFQNMKQNIFQRKSINIISESKLIQLGLNNQEIIRHLWILFNQTNLIQALTILKMGCCFPLIYPCYNDLHGFTPMGLVTKFNITIQEVTSIDA